MTRILITNAMIVNDFDVFNADVWIREGRIAAIGGDLASRTADVVIDAAGRLLMPGLIDMHTHLMQRYGVNWMREKPVSIAWARLRTVNVLASPGTPSSKT